MNRARQKLQPGNVVRIRVNPTNCLSVLDILDTLGIKYHNMSFSQCVSLAFSCLMETSRKQGLIREPDVFEYSNRMSGFADVGALAHKERLTLTQQFKETEGALSRPAELSASEPPEFPSAVERLGISQEEEDAMWARAGELQSKEFLTTAERIELEDLQRKL